MDDAYGYIPYVTAYSVFYDFNKGIRQGYIFL